MTNYESESNIELYQSRVEPAILRKGKGDYVNLRTCDNPKVLEELAEELTAAQSKGIERVFVPWLSPPYNRIIGYGTYTKDQARLLSRRNSKEGWVFPKFGSSYGIAEIKKVIEACSEQSLS